MIKGIFLAVLTMLVLINCGNSENKAVDTKDRMELVPEPDKDLREAYEKQKELTGRACAFSDPDTSVAGIRLRNAQSALAVIGKQTKLEGDSTHVFYSSDNKQKLGLTVHPGDSFSQVSIFTISYAENFNPKLRNIRTKEFRTEKGIKLGISKKAIIEKLGACYVAKDSATNSIELRYGLQLPKDSQTNLLKSYHMPSYYATYRLKNDQLSNIEFGFDYP